MLASVLFSVLPLMAALPSVSALQKNVKPFQFQAVGDVGVSAQMMFLGTKKKVYIIDKAENNPATINGQYGSHPAWAAEYDIDTQKTRLMDVYSNAFCACGMVMGNGTWAVFGGNQPVTTDGVATNQLANYKDNAGGTAIRMLTPDDNGCEYVQGVQTLDIAKDTGGFLQMTGKRWYPTVESLPDGTLIVIGGDKNGGYVNTALQDNPTYEFFPPTNEGAINLQFLSDTLPVNLYPLVWLLPSGKLFMQAALKTILYDYQSKTTIPLADMPYATRVYPGSAATAMLPLKPEENYNPTLLFCGGSAPPQWGDDGGPGYNVTSIPADSSCVRIKPDVTDKKDAPYVDDDRMPEGRSMGQFVILPDGTFFMVNGVAMGTAGYGNNGYSIGQSFGQDPLYMPAIYNPEAPAGSRWNRTGLQPSNNERMYHSTAILLYDGSVLISGSNPNADFTNNQWRSRTDVDRWYPWYYNEPRPAVTGWPEKLSYGGKPFDLDLTLTVSDEASVNNTKVMIIRPGFNTHAVGFGQRAIYLETSYTIDQASKKTTLHVSQLPGKNGPNIFQPGPALIFAVTNGVPSEGEMVMIGTGELGTQPTADNAPLPSSTVVPEKTASSEGVTTGNNAVSDSNKSSAASMVVPVSLMTLGLMLAPLALL